MIQKTILSIDDSKSVHAFIDSCLSKHYNVIHTYSGADGIQALKENNNQISLVLLDWEMPQKSGPDVYKDIRTAGFELPVIMVTTKNKTEDIRQMLSLGVRDYIMKPFTPDILTEKIEMLLSEGVF